MAKENKIEKKLRECEKKLGEMKRLKLVEQSVIAGLKEEKFSEKAIKLFRYRKNFLIIDPEEYKADAVGFFVGSCGDRVDIYLKIKGNIIRNAKYTTDGCPGAVTSGSALTSLLIGKKIDKAQKLNVESVVKYLKEDQKGLPEHMRNCCVIATGALKDAINKYKTIKKKEINKNKISKKDIENALLEAIHPEINSSLVKLGMIKDIKVEDATVLVTLTLPFLEVPIREDLVNLIKKSVKNINKKIKIKIKIAEMNEKEKEKFMKTAREKWKF